MMTETKIQRVKQYIAPRGLHNSFRRTDIAGNVSTISFVKIQELLLSIPDRGAFGYNQNSRIEILGKIGQLR